MIGATITLGVGVAGVTVLLLLKHWETRRGVVVFAGLRARIQEAIRRMFVGGDAASRSFAGVGISVRSILHSIAKSAAAQSLITLERSLERALHTVRRTKNVGAERPSASPFLQEVVAYKKKLRPRASTLRKLGE